MRSATRVSETSLYFSGLILKFEDELLEAEKKFLDVRRARNYLSIEN